MTKNLDEGGSVVLRATMSVVVFWCLAALGAYFVVDAVVRGRWDVGLRALGVLMLVLWAAWAFLYRMSIVVDRRSVVVRNLLRYTSIPWELVDQIERRYQVRFRLVDGTIVESWGSPFPRRGRARRPDPDAATDPALETLRVLQASARPTGDDRVRRGWDLVALLIGVGCAVCALIAVLV